jgi:hypothetical protein
MTKLRDFVAGLARSSKSAAEIKTIVDAAFGDQAFGADIDILYFEEG